MTNNHTGNGPKRRRGEDLERELLKATRAELREVGYRKLSLDSIALRAGTSKAVLYRRWANRAELVQAALMDLQGASIAVPDTGSLRGDLLAIYAYLDEGSKVYPMDIGIGLLSDTVKDAVAHERLMSSIKRDTVGIILPVLERAEARGEIPTSVLPERVITLPLDLARYEIIRTGKMPTRATVTQIVDDICIPLLQAERD